ncbi:hypothetical protein [Enterococcus rivorum]|uniref:Uncharacterized protein n=1 Tax=Enterococcus rivorum TaxID=762845 RepID=A0A1E5L0C9_9ENTE|nr:hypothetical protein [Enterococcus rivorum]MBP2098897.1 hypothetical protein [Enterococcus rivorum]OEH83622.1 hypothetical protein BCR26_09095 [Enterococcus rivorum]
MAEERYKTKELLAELVQFLEEQPTKKVVVEDYFKRTKGTQKWTKPRVIACYKAIQEAKTTQIQMDYVSVQRSEETWAYCMRVTLPTAKK